VAWITVTGNTNELIFILKIESEIESWVKQQEIEWWQEVYWVLATNSEKSQRDFVNQQTVLNFFLCEAKFFSYKCFSICIQKTFDYNIMLDGFFSLSCRGPKISFCSIIIALWILVMLLYKPESQIYIRPLPTVELKTC